MIQHPRMIGGGSTAAVRKDINKKIKEIRKKKKGKKAEARTADNGDETKTQESQRAHGKEGSMAKSVQEEAELNEAAGAYSYYTNGEKHTVLGT